MNVGNTVVYKSENGLLFFWICDINSDSVLMYDWFGNARRPTSADFWRTSPEWLNARIADGTIEVYDSLPLNKYGDIFERQAQCRNATNV